MLVSEIWAAAKSSRGYGNCNEDELYDVITEAVTILADKGSWDWMIGHMTVCAYDGYLTLPREVEKVMAANINGYPSFPRNKWYINHINGSGDYSGIDSYNAFYDEVGEFSTIRNLPEPSMLVAVPENAADEGKELLVYGYDLNNRELWHADPVTGAQVRGIRVPVTQSATPLYPDPVVVRKIDNVVKTETSGCIALWSFPQCFETADDPTLMGYYYPDDTAIRLRRYRFPKTSCVSFKYRRKNLLYRSQNDFIPFDNKTALLLMLKAISNFRSGNLEKGQQYEDKAGALLSASENARKAKSAIGPQVQNFSSDVNERLRGSRAGRHYGSC